MAKSKKPPLGKILTYVFLGLLASIFILLAFNWSLAVYGISQLRGQLAILSGAVEKEKFLEDPSVDENLKYKIRLIDEIKAFGIQELGLEPTDSYSKIYDQKGKEVLWNITASPPFQLEPYQWSFPFLGDFSYKGFFKEEMALEEKARLEEMGYETNKYGVSAWNTLGWFETPILSNNLYKPEGSLVNTILHEMTHGTLFIYDDLQFNENFATLVGDVGAELFLQHKYGKSSEEYQQYVNNKSDYNLYTAHILRGATLLDSLYATFKEETPLSEKKRLKKELIIDIISSMDTIPFYFPELYLNYFRERDLPNNTYFLSYRRYRADLSKLKTKLSEEFNGDLRKMILHYVNKYEG